MANLSRLLPKNFKMNTAQAWVDVPQVANNEPFFKKIWPGLVLFCEEEAVAETFEIQSILSNGKKVIHNTSGWDGCIQYIQNGGWLTPSSNSMLPRDQQFPIMDVLCVVYSNLLGADINVPLKIVGVINDQDIIIEDPLDVFGNTGGHLCTCYFTRLDFYPNKEIQIHDAGGSYPVINSLGGASFQGEIDTSYAAFTWNIKQEGDRPIAPVGILSDGTLNVTVIK